MIQNINLTIESGKFVSLLGASGCGKTTLLRLIAGLETPDSGSINHDERTYYDSNQHTYVSPAERLRDGLSRFRTMATHDCFPKCCVSIEGK